MAIWIVQHLLELLELMTPVVLLVAYFHRDKPYRGIVGEEYRLPRRRRLKLVLK